MRTTAHRDPIGQFVVVGIRVVQETTFLDQQAARVLARTVAAIPAKRALPGQIGNRRDCACDLFTLFFFRQLEMLDPAPAMAADVVLGRGNGIGDARVALQRQGAAEQGQWQATLAKQFENAPDADAAAEFVHAFEREIARAGRHPAARYFGQAQFVTPITVTDGVFGAFLVVEHHVDGDARIARPVGLRWLSAVADKIAGGGHWTALMCRRRARSAPQAHSTHGGRTGPTTRRGSTCLAACRRWCRCA